jgi:hypothetical protein
MIVDDSESQEAPNQALIWVKQHVNAEATYAVIFPKVANM